MPAPTPPTSPLPAGTRAPDFSLAAGPDRRVALEDFRGKPIVLVFYPADWSPVCGDQLAVYSEVIDEFHKLDAQLLGVSVDGPWCHAAYAEAANTAFPLLSDFEPKGEVAKAYGVYEPSWGVCQRALFVIDGEGVVRWSHLSPIDVNPGADGILTALESLRRGRRVAINPPANPTAQGPTLTVPVSARDHTLGRPDAPVVLVEYGDYQCPHCRAAAPVIDTLRQERGETLLFAYRHFPLMRLHPRAKAAAEAAEAAGAAGKFWEMHQSLFDHQKELDLEHLVGLAVALGLDGEKFRQELSAGVHAARVREDLASGVRSGVNGTPTLFINGRRHNGVPSYNAIKAALDEAAHTANDGTVVPPT